MNEDFDSQLRRMIEDLKLDLADLEAILTRREARGAESQKPSPPVSTYQPSNKHLSIRAQAIEALEQAYPREMHVGELVEFTGIRKKEQGGKGRFMLFSIVPALAREGKIEQVARGVYRALPIGKRAISAA